MREHTSHNKRNSDNSFGLMGLASVALSVFLFAAACGSGGSDSAGAGSASKDIPARTGTGGGSESASDSQGEPAAADETVESESDHPDDGALPPAGSDQGAVPAGEVAPPASASPGQQTAGSESPKRAEPAPSQGKATAAAKGTAPPASQANGPAPAPRTAPGPRQDEASPPEGAAANPSGGGAPNPGATDIGVSAEKIKLGTINANSAPLGNIAAVPVYTMVLAKFRAINDEGGIFGRKVEVIDCDDADKSDRFQACYQKAVNQDKIFALTTSFSWGSGWAAGNLERDEIPWIGSWGYFTKEWKNPWMFPVHMATVHEAEAFAQWVVEVIKPKNVGLLYLNAAEQKLALRALQDAFKKADIPIVREIGQDIESADESSNVLAMRAANPDFIVHFSWYLPVTKFMVDAAQQNYWPPKGMGGNHFLGQVFGELVGSWPLQGMYTISTYELWGTEYLATANKYAPQMKARHHHITQSGYIGASIFQQAAKEVGPNLTREGIMKVLESHPWDMGPGMGQSVLWKPGNHDTMRCGHVFKYNTTDSNSYDVYVPDERKFEVCSPAPVE